MDKNSMFGEVIPEEEKPSTAANLAKRVEQRERGKNTPTAGEVPIDWNHVEKLCAMFCTQREISDFLGINHKTLAYRCVTEGLAGNWQEYYSMASVKGKISLRHKQYQQAMDGDRTMLIWLGKQVLGQMDTKHITANVGTEATTTEVKPYNLAKLPTDKLLQLQELMTGAQSDPEPL